MSVPGEAVTEQKAAGALPGVSWADDGERNGQKWDIVYRFAQVGVKKAELDWSVARLPYSFDVDLRSVNVSTGAGRRAAAT